MYSLSFCTNRIGSHKNRNIFWKREFTAEKYVKNLEIKEFLLPGGSRKHKKQDGIVDLKRWMGSQKEYR